MVSVARIELALHGPKPRVMPFHYTENYQYLVDRAGLEPASLNYTFPKPCIRIQATIDFVLAAEESIG